MYNEFYETLSLNSNEKILAIYKNRNNYVDEAQESIVKILKERDLYDEALELEKKDEQEIQKNENENRETFESRIFGSYMSNIEFANKSLSDNNYFSSVFSAAHLKEHFFSNISLFLGTIGVTGIIIFFIMNEYRADFILYFATPSFILSLFLIIGIRLRQSSKALVKLQMKDDENIELTITMNKKNIEIAYPFNYEYYWTNLYNVEHKIKQVDLWILIYIDKNTIISLNETLDASKPPPPHWEPILNREIPLKPKFSFTNYAFKQPNLYKLQKILDGINEQYLKKNSDKTSFYL